MSQLDLFDRKSFSAPKTKNKRKAPIDLIYTIQGADATCCLAVRAGIGYGIQSKSYRLCPYLGKHRRKEHKVLFIDNEYSEYDHSVHLRALDDIAEKQKQVTKYATVRDLMTPVQCKSAGIEWFSFDQIMRWAEEVEQRAERVIVIPKYDCIADIPERYVLGYSVPSSHGGTPLLTDLFRGREVHLLGGSWKQQIKYWIDLWDEVVSLDNNHCQKVSQYGTFYYPDGRVGKVSETLRMHQAVNPRYIALAISFGNMVGYARELQARVEREIDHD